MIRRLLCFLGFHKWEFTIAGACDAPEDYYLSKKCKKKLCKDCRYYLQTYCKRCGRWK